MKRKKTAGYSVAGAFALLLVVKTASAATDYSWTNADGDNNYMNGNNWTTNGVAAGVPEGANNAIIGLDGADKVVLSAGQTNNNIAAIYVGQASDGAFEQTGGKLTATMSSSSFSRVGWGSGKSATWTMTGGYANINAVQIGLDSGDGALFLKGGEMVISRGGTDGTSLRIDNGGTGLFEISGGSLETRTGVRIGGQGVFRVKGAAASNIGIGSNNTLDGYWNQESNGVLQVQVSSNGLRQILIDDTGGSSAQATFEQGAILDVAFLDGYAETNVWTVMTVEGTLTDLGLRFAASVDTNLWDKQVTNNTLIVAYGIDLPDSGTPTNAPPTVDRTLYWTGLAGDSDPTKAGNWATDTAGTPATWGIYGVENGDELHIGDYHLNDGGFVSEVTYEGGTPELQKTLWLGERRTGVFNMDGGILNFGYNGPNTLGSGSADGKGTLNVNAGTLGINAVRMGAAAGAEGAINLNGGIFTIGRGYRLGSLEASIWLGYAADGIGKMTVSGGTFKSRTGLVLGYADSMGEFSVVGSAGSIGIGLEGSLAGFWLQKGGSVLRARIDTNGVSQVLVKERDGASGYVEFENGAVLDLGWMPGVTNYGSWDLMFLEGDNGITNNGLVLASGVDTNVWSFNILDTDGNGKKDTLRVTAYGETPQGTSIPWLIGYGLTEADDLVDNDGDGLLTWEEYVAGTIPTDSSSVLAVDSAEFTGGGYIISWRSVEGKRYSIVAKEDLIYSDPQVIASGIIGLPSETSYTGTVNGATALFYKIGVE